MKKFTFLLALIAVLALNAAAFAAENVIALSDGTYSNGRNGIVSSDRAVSGDYGTKIYYVGDAKTVTNGSYIRFGIKLDGAELDADTPALKAKLFGASGFTKIDGETYTKSKVEYPKGYIVLAEGIDKPANYEIGVTQNSDEEAWVLSKTHKSLDIIPTKVGFDSAITVKSLKGSTGSADISADFAEKNPGIVLNSLGNYGDSEAYMISYDKSGTPAVLENKTATVINGLNVAYDADTFTITVSNDQATPAKGGTTVELEIVLNHNDAFKIDEGDIEHIIVIDDSYEKDVIGKITIDVEESAVDQLVDQLIDAISKDADLADGVNIVDADGKVVPESGIITISEDHDIVLNIISLDKTTLTPFPITSADADKVVIAQGATHHSLEASVKPSSVRIDDNYILSVTITASDIEALKKTVAASSVRAAAVVVEDYDFHLDALGKTLGLVYQTAEEVPGSSSGGACDMGFGLVAIAGLAALALRKRSK